MRFGDREFDVAYDAQRIQPMDLVVAVQNAGFSASVK
jgi:hypothetical protein